MIIAPKPKVIATRSNFEFLDNGSMRIVGYFNGIVEALVDAVKNHEEDLDDMISMVFVQTNPTLRPKLVELINKK